MRTVAIVGSHPRTAPHYDQTRTDCDLWVFNEAIPQGKFQTATATFQMHDPVIWRNPNNRNCQGYAAWLRETDVPAWMREVYPDVPASRRYPLDEIKATLLGGWNFEAYFTSSVAYALALAIYLGYERIELYGVEMETDTEYRYQRDGVTFWLGLAIGRGIQVYSDCTIFDALLYGYEGDLQLEYELFTGRVTEHTAALEAQKEVYEAAWKQASDIVKAFVATGRNANGVVEAVKGQIGAGIEYTEMDGAKQESERYLKKADTMRAESGGFLFSRQEFEQSAQALWKKREETINLANSAGGALEMGFRSVENVPNAIKRKKRFEALVPTIDQYIRKSLEVGIYTGAYKENLFYLGILDKRIKAAGGVKSEAVMMAAAMAAKEI